MESEKQLIFVNNERGPTAKTYSTCNQNSKPFSKVYFIETRKSRKFCTIHTMKGEPKTFLPPPILLAQWHVRHDGSVVCVEKV